MNLMMKDPTIEIIEAEYCPEAVIDWYECTGGSQHYKSVGNDKNKCRRDLSSKAKKHLCALGWTFWYANKKTKQEIRFKSPNGKSYNSLKTACKRCIDDGVCVSYKTSDPVEVVESSFEVAHTDITTLEPGPRAYKKSRVQARRCNKKRRRGDSSEIELPRRCFKKVRESKSSDDEWTPELVKRMTQCTRLRVDVSKKRPKVLRFGKRVRKENCGEPLMDGQKEALVSQNSDFSKQGIIDNSHQYQSDNICSICQEVGEVMLCDNCPSVFHYTCLGLEKVPDGDWFCSSCCCRLCNRTKCREDCEADVIFNRGSELKRLNFRGFYTVTLERNNEVISVATMRIYGQRVAEVPLIATMNKFRRQGMCRILMNGIENLLNQFGVKRLVLPSAHDMVDTWRNSFGFARMNCADKFQLREYTFLDFQGSIMCHKPLMKSQLEHVMC
ncbi:PREDICTED: uncharacterized protein LOC109342624 isoform X2 [Lupinus angustifolius]|uniref:uncharacterized protein LOC109342624 isoform X2 n=1 Tax=Lupinus angustifolius TaxID=3871 RepID=UPI00092E9A42|nr:PREDICTED: uncharacterized protein LOC109342624 isoform X2 [Lupinus angustifolius]